MSLKPYSTRNYEALPAGFGVGRLNASAAALRSGFVRIRGHLRRSGAAYVVLAISLLLTALAYYYVLVTWATVVALANYLRRGVPAVWEKAEGTR